MDIEVSKEKESERDTKTISAEGEDFVIDHYDHDGGFFTLNWMTDYEVGDAASSTSEFLDDLYDGELSQEDFVGGIVCQDRVESCEITGGQAYGVVSDILKGGDPRRSFISNVDELSDDEEITFFRLNTRKANPAWDDTDPNLGVVASYPAGEELAEYALETANANADKETVQEMAEVLEAETGDYATDF
jgi:hypothetical protein